MQNIATLAQAALSESGEVQLVERQELQKVIDEQMLTDSGLVDADRAIAVGALVSCDLFASIEGDKSDGSLIVFDAHSGVRLCDAPIRTNGGDESAANDLTTQLRGAVAKARRIAAGQVLCIHTVRNADLPHTFDPTCRAAAKLLERQLCGLPDVSILERSRLDKLTDEHQLTGVQAALTASTDLLDLQMARSPSADAARHGLIDITVVVKGLGGNTLANVSASVNDPDAQAMAEAIFPKLVEALKLAAPPRPTSSDRALEANQFSRETLMHWQHSEIGEALESAEAAYALNPGNRHLLALRARALAVQAAALLCAETDFANPSDPTDPCYSSFGPHQGQFVLSFQYASEALNAISIAQVRVGRNWPLSSDPVYRQSPVLDDDLMIRNALQVLRKYLAQVRSEQSERNEKRTGIAPLVFDSEEQKAYAEALLAFRHYRLEMEEPVARKLVTDAATYQAYCVYLTNLLYDLRCVCALDGKQWTTDWKTVVDAWIPLAVQYGMPDAGNPGVPRDAEGGILVLAPLYDLPAGNALWGGPELKRSDWSGLAFSKSWRMTFEDWQRYRSIYEEVGAAIPSPRARQLDRAAEHNIDATLAALKAPGAAPSAPLARIDPRVLHGAETPPPPLVGPGSNWPDSKLLLDAGDPNNEVDEIGFPAVAGDGKSAYAIATLRGLSSRHGPALLKFDLATGRYQTVAAFDPINTDDAAADPQPLRIDQARFGGSYGSICGDWFVLCDMASGIFLFPLSGGAVQLIDARTSRLPADNYQAAAVLDGTLYMSIGQPNHDGYLLAYDLQTAGRKTLAASRRVAVGSQAVSPFDNSAPLFTWFMRADPVRRRIVFLIGNAAWEKGKSGWWSYEPATGQFKQLYAFDIVCDPVQARDATWAVAQGDKLTFSSAGRTPAVLDLASDTVSAPLRIPACQNFGLDGRQFPSGAALGEPLTEADGWTWGKFGRFRSSTVKFSNGRVTNTTLLQCFDPPTPGNYRCGEWPPFLTVIDGDHVLACDVKSLWSMHIPSADPAAMARTMRTPQPRLVTVERTGAAPDGGELPWSAVKTVYDVAGYKDGVLNMRGPIIRGDFVYVLASGVGGRSLGSVQLRRYGLLDGSQTDYGEDSTGFLPETPPANIAEQIRTNVNVEMALDNNHYYVAETDQRRIAVFTFDNSRPKHIALTLPRGDWRGFAGGIDGKLVVAMETVPIVRGDQPWTQRTVRAKLFEIDVDSGKTTEIPLPAPAQPLDDKEAIHIGPVAFDEAHKRVLFFMCRQTPEPDFDGVYAFDATGVVRIIPVDVDRDMAFGAESFAPDLMVFRWCDRVRNDRWVFGYSDRACEANLTSQRVRSLCPPIDSGKRRPLSPPMAIVGTWLYHAGFGRVGEDGTEFDQFPSLRPLDAAGYPFSGRLLEPTADDKSLIVADNCGMWVLKLQ